MKKIISVLCVVILTVILCMGLSVIASADEVETVATAEAVEQTEDNSTSAKALAAGIAIAIVAAVGALSMGIAISKTNEAIARQPEAKGDLRTSMMLGLVFIETAIIYALIVAILIIFVL